VYQDRRAQAGIAIIWRAAAIHPELWTGMTSPPNPDPNNPPQLNTRAIEELLDRRVRIVERMDNQANAPQNETKRTSVSPKGWRDASRVRMFEYPYFTAPRATDLIALTDPEWKTDTFLTPEGIIKSEKITFFWKVPTPANAERHVLTRVGDEDNPPPALHPVWVPPDQPYAYQRTYNPSAETLATAIGNLTQPALNVWKRSWFFCDHTIATPSRKPPPPRPTTR
jgi:hypothetical protein